MKFYLLISLISLALLALAPANRHKLPLGGMVWEAQKVQFKSSFKKNENAQVLWGILAGERSQISGKTLHAFKAVNLTFLFHPAGLQLSSIMLLLHWLIKKWVSKNKKKWITLLTLMAFYFLPFLALKRLVLLRLMNLTPFFKRHALKKEILFFLCFAISFLLGHYLQSPGSFAASFLYIGTFISFSGESKKQILLALIANQFLLALCWHQSFNPVGVILCLPLLSLMNVLAPLGYCYLITYRLIKINWIEILVENYLKLLKSCAKFAHSMETIPSMMLFLLIWLLLVQAKPRWIAIWLSLCSAVAMAPTISY